ncbi:MAG: tRNA uridine-5-carboxymethylaminomethyl(34) synthesis GTPase MnmE [Candidatus Cloacimonadota bacterium]|nr:tRNA uridine-5-carboxymethylaminomethyl(34) synthesis GTPase MnmE [Candidatus Cloacimonadota bacterium]
MQSLTDTIVAISTPSGIGGISIIRISGENAINVLSKSYKGKIATKNFRTHSIYFGKIFDGNQLIDDVLVSVFIAPHSYTGEDVIEISCHGGNFVTQIILQIMLRNGARMALPGEFTKRAFLNGKMDLTEAEAVIDLIQAKTKHSQEAAIYQLEGKLYSAIKKILNEITELRSQLELDLDFSDQGLEYITTEGLLTQLKVIKKEISALVRNGNEGIILSEGYRIVIAGEPNAGKSSLFNKIVENERAIVTEIPGTTRDYIEEDIALKGYLIKLFDTAGLQESKDKIEKVGIEKSVDIIKQANLILWVRDITVHKQFSIKEQLTDKDIIEVFNKIDLVKRGKKSDSQNVVYISALSGEGISALKNKIIIRIDLGKYDISNGLISNTRQLAAAKKSLQAIKQAIKTTQKNLGLEFIAFDLREASEALEEIIGKVTSDNIINSIFDRFCVGK